MAKPRIFISSTYYDLKQIRSDIEKFIKDLGYEPVLNERGHIPYGSDDRLEEYCYKEISKIDIVIAIIGGRFGTQSHTAGASISQLEIKTALDLNKQVYIFIDKNVSTEYEIYQMNKGSGTFIPKYVDDVRVHEFISFIQKLPKNNAVFEFNEAHDILVYLKEQWAGLFQRYLQENSKISEFNLIKDLKRTSETLNGLVEYLAEEKKNSDVVIQDILLRDHPAMEQIKKMLGVQYRVFFVNIDELREWLISRGYREIENVEKNNYFTFLNIEKKDTRFLLKIDKDLFNSDGTLKVITKSGWNSNMIIFEAESTKQEIDNLPF